MLLAASAMGTRFELVLPDDGSPESERRSAGEAALAEVVELDARLSLFRKDSLLSHINRVAPREWVRLDEDTFALLALCVRIWRDSDGAFDVTVAPLMRQWGLHVDSVLPDGNPAGGPVPICGPEGCVIPSGALRSALRAHTRSFETGTCAPFEARSALPSGVTPNGAPSPDRADSGAIELDADARSIRFRAPIALDLGGVAKGFALDAALTALRDAGVANAFLQGGTSAIAALGVPKPEDGVTSRPWHVAIAVPESAAPRGIVTVPMRDMALCVSAHHGRTADGYGHIIEPRSATPAQRPGDAPIRHAADVAAVIADLTTADVHRPCAAADAWTKPVLLGAVRPARLPASMTTMTADDGAVRIDGPHAARMRSSGGPPAIRPVGG